MFVPRSSGLFSDEDSSHSRGTNTTIAKKMSTA